MASELRVDTLKDSSGNNSVGMAYVAEGSAKLWTSFANTSGTPSALQSHNQSSITDSGSGHYGINTTNAFSNTEYSAQCTGSAEQGFGCVASVDLSKMTASKLQFYTVENNSTTIQDFDRNNAQAHGDLA